MDCLGKIDRLKIQFLDMLTSLNDTKECITLHRLNTSPPPSPEKDKTNNPLQKTTKSRRNKTSAARSPAPKRRLAEDYIRQCHPQSAAHRTALKKPERDVLKDVLLVLQNVEGDHIKITEAGTVEVSNQTAFLASLPPSLIATALGCCRAGVFARKILGFLGDNEGRERGIVWQRFCSVVRGYVLDYLAVLSEMEGLLDSDALTVLKLRIAIAPITKTLENICSLSAALPKTVSSNQSGPIASFLYDVHHNAAPFSALKTVAKDFFEQCAEPLWKMIFSWTTQGELIDPFGEFFVFKSEDSENGPIFGLKRDSVPAFISPATASKIFQIGTTVQFIKEHSAKTVRPEGKMEWGLSPRALETAIESFEKNLSERLIETLFGDFNFFRHFQCIQRFILHFQGDFMDFLLDSTIDLMGKNERHCTPKTVNYLIQKSLVDCGYCMGKNLDTELFFIELSRIEKPGNIDGLDAFSLCYRLGPKNPLKIIFKESFEPKYKKIFSFLWKLRYAVKLLNTVHSKGMEIAKLSRRRELNCNKLNFKKLILTGFLMRSYLLRIQSGFFYDGVEAVFRDFLKKCESSVTIDELIMHHAAFLDKVTEKLFLSKMQMYHLIICVIKISIVFAKRSEMYLNDILVKKDSLSNEGRLDLDKKIYEATCEEAETFKGYCNKMEGLGVEEKF